MISIFRPGSVVYPDKFKAGDRVKCLTSIRFSDGTHHVVGQIIKVTKESVSYFNVCHEDYEKVQ